MKVEIEIYVVHLLEHFLDPVGLVAVVLDHLFDAGFLVRIFRQ